jgi:hypothetical protein
MDYSDWLHFVSVFACFALPAVVGMVVGGQLIPLLIGATGFGILFFFVVPGFLCRHCPFYAERGLLLRCPAHFGSLKLWRYKPGPLNRLERTMVYIGFALIFGYPLPFLALSGQWAFLLLAVWGTFTWFFTMRKYICSSCVNFHCPMNGVPEKLVAAYHWQNMDLGRVVEKTGATRPSEVRLHEEEHSLRS